MVKTIWDGAKYSDLNGKIPVCDLCEAILADAKSLLKTRYRGNLTDMSASDVVEEIFWDLPEYDGVVIPEEASKIVLIVSADLSSEDINRWIAELEIGMTENNASDILIKVYKKDNKELCNDLVIDIYYIYDQIYNNLPVYISDSINWIREYGCRSVYYQYIEYLTELITTEHRIIIDEDSTTPYELLYSNSRELGVAKSSDPETDFKLFIFRWKQINILELN